MAAGASLKHRQPLAPLAKSIKNMTSQTLQAQIQEHVKTAMKARDQQRLNALRLITAAFKQQEVDSRQPLTEVDVLAILDKMIKQRKESIKQYAAANREDLVNQEQFEVSVIEQFLPAQLTANEIDALIKEAINQSGASSAKDMGKVMALLKPKVQGRCDFAQVSQKVKEQLS